MMTSMVSTGDSLKTVPRTSLEVPLVRSMGPVVTKLWPAFRPRIQAS